MSVLLFLHGSGWPAHTGQSLKCSSSLLIVSDGEQCCSWCSLPSFCKFIIVPTFSVFILAHYPSNIARYSSRSWWNKPLSILPVPVSSTTHRAPFCSSSRQKLVRLLLPYTFSVPHPFTCLFLVPWCFPSPDTSPQPVGVVFYLSAHPSTFPIPGYLDYPFEVFRKHTKSREARQGRGEWGAGELGESLGLIKGASRQYFAPRPVWAVFYPSTRPSTFLISGYLDYPFEVFRKHTKSREARQGRGEWSWGVLGANKGCIKVIPCSSSCLNAALPICTPVYTSHPRIPPPTCWRGVQPICMPVYTSHPRMPLLNLSAWCSTHPHACLCFPSPDTSSKPVGAVLYPSIRLSMLPTCGRLLPQPAVWCSTHPHACLCFPSLDIFPPTSRCGILPVPMALYTFHPQILLPNPLVWVPPI